MNNSAEHTARHYFELSNQAELAAVAQLFQSDATYSSDRTGLYYGVSDIMTMMENFFAGYHQIQWQIEQLACFTEHIVEIRFSCQTIDHQGSKTERLGVERLVIVDGLIRHIEVRSH